jgi:hypothetical protein
MGSLLSFGRGGQEPLPTGLPLFAQDHQGLIEEANLARWLRWEQRKRGGGQDKAVSIG